ncbi:AI-2E family transporter [Neobacillus terrae]|uniref:AI-2E family transporter n=1 Tax=Neobacillus terrae TaxID=3034837 RepID=UPI00140922D5|nr:AI-2E family transporter [Neobacillus terrae]NHM32263.1 AI-2E family transporter [Neobacillus terrae]
MWIHKPFFKYATGTLLVLFIIYMLGKIDYFLWPFQKLIATIFFPLIISGLFYYILRPIVRFLAKYVNKNISILIVFLLFFGLAYLFFYLAGAPISGEVQNITKQFPEKVEKISDQSKKVLGHNTIGSFSVDKLEQSVNKYTSSVFHYVQTNVTSIIQIITSIASVLVVVPFIVFYLLKDDEKIRPALLTRLPEDHVMEGNRILLDIDKTLSTYIVGQMIIALSDGILLSIGFLIIGLKNSILLAIFAMLMTIVPFLGPIIGIVPAVLVGLLMNPFMAVKVIIVTIITQQIDGNLITPRVMGKRLDLHPLTVILILLVAGSIYGFIGILISIPLYSVVKVTVKNLIKFYKLRNTGIVHITK